MQLEMKNLLEKTCESCYLEGEGLFGFFKQGGATVRPGWEFWLGGAPCNRTRQNPKLR
jgi:hypothetical protein